MGYTRNRFMLVFSWSPAVVEASRAVALDVFKDAPHLVGPIMSGVVNHWSGFTVWTSGSKCGWSDDDAHIARLDELGARLAEVRTPPEWARVDAGEEAGDLVARHGRHGWEGGPYQVTELRGQEAG